MHILMGKRSSPLREINGLAVFRHGSGSKDADLRRATADECGAVDLSIRLGGFSQRTETWQQQQQQHTVTKCEFSDWTITSPATSQIICPGSLYGKLRRFSTSFSRYLPLLGERFASRTLPRLISQRQDFAL